MADEKLDLTATPGEVFDLQMKTQGVGVITVKDGTAFLFSAPVLEKLLEAARQNKDQRAMVFIKREVPS